MSLQLFCLGYQTFLVLHSDSKCCSGYGEMQGHFGL